MCGSAPGPFWKACWVPPPVACSRSYITTVSCRRVASQPPHQLHHRLGRKLVQLAHRRVQQRQQQLLVAVPAGRRYLEPGGGQAGRPWKGGQAGRHAAPRCCSSSTLGACRRSSWCAAAPHVRMGREAARRPARSPQLDHCGGDLGQAAGIKGGGVLGRLRAGQWQGVGVGAAPRGSREPGSGACRCTPLAVPRAPPHQPAPPQPPQGSAPCHTHLCPQPSNTRTAAWQRGSARPPTPHLCDQLVDHVWRGAADARVGVQDVGNGLCVCAGGGQGQGQGCRWLAAWATGRVAREAGVAGGDACCCGRMRQPAAGRQLPAARSPATLPQRSRPVRPPMQPAAGCHSSRILGRRRPP